MTDTPYPPDLGSASKPWFLRRGNITLMWRIYLGIMVGTVVLQLFYAVHGYWPIEDRFAFAAGFAFVASVLQMLITRVLGWWLRRPEDYYPEEHLFLWAATTEERPDFEKIDV